MVHTLSAGKKRRREEDDDADYVDDEQGSSSPRGSPKRRRSIRKGGTGRGGSTSTATTSHSPKSSPASSGRTVVNSTYVAPTQGGSGSGAAPESSSSKSRGARASRLVNRIAKQPLPQGPTPAVPTGTTASQAPADASEPVLPLSPPDMAGGDWPISFSVQGDQLLSVVDPHASSSWDIPQPPPPLQEFRTEGDIDKFFDESPDADIDAYFNDGTLIRRVQRPMLASSNWDVQQLGGTNDNAGEQAPLLPPKKETSSPPTAATISGIPPGQFQDSTSPSAPEDLSPPRQPKQALGRPFHPISPPSRESRVPSSDIPLTSSASYPSLLSNIPALPSPRRHPSLAQASSSSPRTPSGTRLSLQSSRSQHQASPRPAAGPMSLPSVPQIGSGNNAGEAQGQRPSSRAAQLPPAVPSQLGGSPPALVQSQGQALPQPQRVAQLGQAPQQLRYPPAEIQSNYPVGVGGYRPAPSTMSQTQAQQYTAAHQLGGAYLSPRRAALQQSSPMSQSVQIAGTPGSTTTISGHGSPSVVTPTPSGPLLASGLAGIDGPAPVGSFSVPSSTPQEVSAANRREKNVPHYPSANLVGGTTSKISLTIAIETDGLFYDGPAHKRLRVPITVISAPTSNVRTDLWPKPSFQLTPGSMSGPIVWRDFFAFLEEHSIPTCSLRANTRTAGGIKAFELEYLASFDRICRYMIDQQCFARVPFRVPGGPAGAGIALFPSIGEHFSSAGVVSLHAAFFGKMDIPAASDFKQTYSPASDTEQQYGGGSAVLEATGSPGGPVQGFSSSAPQPSTPYPPLGAYRGVPTPVGASPYPQFYAPSTVGPPTMTANPYPPGPHIQPMHPLRSHSLDTAPSASNYPAPHRASTYGIAPTLQAGQPSEVSIHSPPRMAPATAHALAQNHQPRYQHAASDMAGATPTLTQAEPGRGLTQHQAIPTVWTTPPVTLSPDAQSQLSTLPNMSGQQQGYPAPLGYSSYPYPVAPSAVPVYQPIGDTGGDGGAGFSPAADAAMSQYFSFSPPQWATPGAAGASGQSMSPQHYPSGVPTSMGTNVNITTSTTTPPTTMMTSPDRHFVQPSNPETQLTLSESPASSSYLQHDYPHTQQVHSQQQHYPHLYPQSN
ncbi:hypothetical protein DL93DRAFT_1011676 [Clavulina sp. PMI_390]|nr:hypothetical protein DL93DRAFT_1011676 [Clavulina sp. PMI_390]